jgi:hypothetical protein
VVSQWLAKMKKTTRYTWKMAVAAVPAAPVTEAPVEPAAPSEENPPAPPAAPAVPTFDTLEDARVYLLSEARDKVVRTTETARFHGKLLDTMPPGEIRYAVEGALERQRRFPLDTANALRGRLRREHFTIFKKGSKGVSYVCAVKRKFRVPGQTFADSIGSLISFIEASPMVRASELASKFLGLANVPAPKPVPPVEPAPVAESVPTAAATEGAPAGETVPPPPAEPVVTKPEGTLSIEDRARLARLQGDLMWLVREGYVTEFIDGRLFAPPPMVEARKKEIESEEHDPENFPEVPPPSAAVMPAAGDPVPVSLAEDVAAEPLPLESAPVPPSPAEVSATESPAESLTAPVAPVEESKLEPPPATDSIP